jgi:hypothetical protein
MKTSHFVRMAAGCTLVLATGCAATPRVSVNNAPAFHRAIRAAAAGGTIALAPGHYRLAPAAYVDSTCGNCQDAAEDVPASLGMRIAGRSITIAGTHRDSVIIHTGAGYGLLIEDCQDCVLRNVTITGGVRDPDGRATDAAIVVRRSTVRIEQCAIRDNIGDSATVAKTIVGIAGIAVREGGQVTVSGCEIIRNSWDGIAMYRGARAHISDNLVDGVDKAAGGRVGGGRGVGIGLTWDAQAVVERNRVTRYWKGIGVFVEASADVRENIVEDILTWGIAFWGPDGGTPDARIEHNVVYQTGACGVYIERPDGGDAPGTLIGNVVSRTGQNTRYDAGEPYCWQRPVARHHVPAGFVERDNVLFDNRQPVEAGNAPGPLSEANALPGSARELLQRLRGYRAHSGSIALRSLE